MKLKDLKLGDKIHVRNFISDDEYFKLASEYYPNEEREQCMNDLWYKEIKKIFGKEVKIIHFEEMKCIDKIKRPTISIKGCSFFLIPGFVAELHSKEIKIFEDEL